MAFALLSLVSSALLMLGMTTRLFYTTNLFKNSLRYSLSVGLPAALLLLHLAPAQAQNPEDDPIPDEDAPARPAPARPSPPRPIAPTPANPTAPPAPVANPQTPSQKTPPQNPAPAPIPPIAPPPTTTGDPNEAVTLTRGQLNELLRQQAELQRQIDELKRSAATTNSTPGTDTTGAIDTTPSMSGSTGVGIQAARVMAQREAARQPPIPVRGLPPIPPTMLCSCRTFRLLATLLASIPPTTAPKTVPRSD